ncbi:TPA: hypothetical protein ACRMSW_002518 [Pseudomonas aeruginosa]
MKKLTDFKFAATVKRAHSILKSIEAKLDRTEKALAQHVACKKAA